ncbi:hypothetical protein [Streptomyces lavendulae]|uniref:hypothetical protein n=1 Tax=Streptomyces lavendulae TaxID=1914 RepID=UPI00367FD4A9
MLVEERGGDGRRVGEPAVQGGPADPGGLGDLVHRHRPGVAFGEQLLGGAQDLGPVADRVRPLSASGGRNQATGNRRGAPRRATTRDVAYGADLVAIGHGGDPTCFVSVLG